MMVHGAAYCMPSLGVSGDTVRVSLFAYMHFLCIVYMRLMVPEVPLPIPKNFSGFIWYLHTTYFYMIWVREKADRYSTIEVGWWSLSHKHTTV